MNKKIIILINGFYKTDSLLWQVEQFRKAIEARECVCEVHSTDELIVWVDGFNIISGLGQCDYILYLDKDYQIGKMLEEAGYTLVNNIESIALCDNKMNTYIKLAGEMRMPYTISSPLFYAGYDDGSILEKVENKLGYPMIVKESYGSFGKQVYKINSRKELIEIRKKLIKIPHIYQELISSSYGKDIRMIVLNGKYVCAMERANCKDFRSNIELGGVGISITPPEEFITMAEKAAKKLNLFYCGVDIMYDKDNQPILCEVNSNAYFNTISKVCGIDIADLYISTLLEQN